MIKQRLMAGISRYPLLLVLRQPDAAPPVLVRTYTRRSNAQAAADRLNGHD